MSGILDAKGMLAAAQAAAQQQVQVAVMAQGTLRDQLAMCLMHKLPAEIVEVALRQAYRAADLALKIRNETPTEEVRT